MRSFLLIVFLLLLLLLVVSTFAGYGKKIAPYIPKSSNTKALTKRYFNSFSWMHGIRSVDQQVNAPVALLTQKKG